VSLWSQAVRILVVEDERKVASFIRSGLREEGYAVDVAEDGERGDFLASTNDYDLILLDVMLPGMDGVSLAKKIRGAGDSTPIIMLTAKDAVNDKVTGLDAGADDYLTKPFDFAELLARIRSAMRKGGGLLPVTLRVADLSLDRVAHQATRAGREIDLTVKEYALLEFMMLHAGTVVTRTMIAEHVWDIHFDSFTNVIDVYINYLRRKIDGGREQKLIHTIRGRGYMLKE
jgi:heavy metal response regulator